MKNWLKKIAIIFAIIVIVIGAVFIFDVTTAEREEIKPINVSAVVTGDKYGFSVLYKDGEVFFKADAVDDRIKFIAFTEDRYYLTARTVLVRNKHKIFGEIWELRLK